MSSTVRRLFIALLLCLPVCMSTVSTFAQSSARESTTDSEARGLFERGTAAYNRGEYEDAKRYFQAAYNLSGRSALLYNIGLSAEHLRQDEEALDAYRRFLELEPESQKRDQVKARVKVLERALSGKEEQPATVATPEQAAQTVAVEPEKPSEQTAPVEPRSASTTPLYKRWWVWTAVAVVAAGASVGIALALRDPGEQEPIAGDNGLVVQALEAR